MQRTGSYSLPVSLALSQHTGQNPGNCVYYILNSGILDFGFSRTVIKWVEAPRLSILLLQLELTDAFYRKHNIFPQHFPLSEFTFHFSRRYMCVVCIYICMYVDTVCVSVHICIYVWKPRVDVGCWSWSPSTLFIASGSLTESKVTLARQLAHCIC